MSNHPSSAMLKFEVKPWAHHAAMLTAALVAIPPATTAVLHDWIGPHGSRRSASHLDAADASLAGAGGACSAAAATSNW